MQCVLVGKHAKTCVAQQDMTTESQGISRMCWLFRSSRDERDSNSSDSTARLLSADNATVRGKKKNAELAWACVTMAGKLRQKPANWIRNLCQESFLLIVQLDFKIFPDTSTFLVIISFLMNVAFCCFFCCFFCYMC